MLDMYGQRECTITIQGKQVKGREILLPIPPSENTRVTPNFACMYANSKRKGALKNSTNYNRWINASRNLLRKGKLPIITGNVTAYVTLVFPDNRTRDADNRLKGLFDSWTKSECLIEDDRFIDTVILNKKVIKGMSFCLSFLMSSSDIQDLGLTLNQNYLNSVCARLSNED